MSTRNTGWDFEVGDRVRSAGEDEECGVILQIGGERPDTGAELADDVAWVGWDQGVRTPCNLSELAYEDAAAEAFAARSR